MPQIAKRQRVSEEQQVDDVLQDLIDLVNGKIDETNLSYIPVKLINDVPASSSADGNFRLMAVDDDYLYVKTSAGWKRTAPLSTF